MTNLDRLLLHIFLIILLCSTASSVYIPSFMEFGSCSNVPQQENFDINKYLGTWYPVLLVPNEFVPTKHCIAYNYTMMESHQVTFSETGLNEDRAKLARQLIMDLSENDEYTFITPSTGIRPTIHTTIMATDYSSYACMYSCLDKLGFKGQFAWVLSREPRLQRFKVEKCKAIIKENIDLDWEKLTFVEQGETCPYWARMTAKRQGTTVGENVSLDKTQAEEWEDAIGPNEVEDTDAMLELFGEEDHKGRASTLNAGVEITLFLLAVLWALK